MTFRDHFSSLAEDYSRHRPRYPRELFSYLATLPSGHELSWECGTGNGQAAVGLAEYFERVVATDASEKQLRLAFQHPNVEYRAAPADNCGLDTGSVDLVTVAQAVHWFDFEPFYREVRRVLKPRGVLAVLGYQLPKISSEVDRVVAHYFENTLEGCWSERIRFLMESYRTLPFPFEEIEPQAVSMQTAWDLHQLVGFLASWSGTKRCLERDGTHPLERIWGDLVSAWGDPEQKRAVRWPLFMRVGRV